MSLAVTSSQSAVGALVCRRAVRVAEDATLRQVAVAMRAANVSATLVGRGRAIVTERDLTDALARDLSPDETVVEVASERPVVTPHDTSVVDAAALMLNHDVRHLVVAMPDGGAAVVSLRDVMAVLLQAAYPGVWLASLRVSVSSSPERWWG